MKANIYYLGCIFLFFLSCSKDEIIDRRASINMGEITNDLLITILSIPDTLFAEYNRDDELSIDLNLDGKKDIKIVCWNSGSPGWGVDYGSDIAPLDNKTSILSFERMDTVFYYQGQDTVFHENFIEIFNSTFYESVNRHNSDSIHSITKRDYPIFLYTNDEISHEEKWENKILAVRSAGNGGGYNEQTNDDENNIIYYDWTTKYKIYGNWPIGDILYLGIKYNDKLGWIKVKLTSPSAMIIYEYALQK